jgi:uncharacterized protein (DUF302 family)
VAVRFFSAVISAGAHRCIQVAGLSVLLLASGVCAGSPVKTVKIAGDFNDTLMGVKSAVRGKGINIAHTLPASFMLNRTARDFGITENVFADAETIEFCSARISHKLAQANHENILLCPFTISVYTLTKDPGHVYLSWRRPFTLPGEESAAAVKEVEALIESIISEATEW